MLGGWDRLSIVTNQVRIPVFCFIGTRREGIKTRNRKSYGLEGRGTAADASTMWYLPSLCQPKATWSHLIMVPVHSPSLGILEMSFPPKLTRIHEEELGATGILCHLGVP